MNPGKNKIYLLLNEKYAHVENIAVIFLLSICNIFHYTKLVYWTIIFRLSGG